MIFFKRIIKCLFFIYMFTTISAFAEESDHGHHHEESKIDESSGAHKDEDEHNHKEVGAHESSEADGHEDEKEFEVSKKAMLLMKIKTAQIKSLSSGKFTVPTSAILSYGENYGIYKYDGEHFSLIPLGKIIKTKSSVTIESNGLKANDQVVISGVPLLRVSHLQASGQGGEGHAH